MHSTSIRLLSALAVAVPSTIGAQVTVTVLSELRVKPSVANLTEIGEALVGRHGELILTQPEDGVVRIFNSTGTSTSFGRKGEGPGEFRQMGHAAWKGDTLWVEDHTLNRLVLFGPGYKFSRTVAVPRASDLHMKSGGPHAFDGAVWPVALVKTGLVLETGLAGSGPPPPWVPKGHASDYPILLAGSDNLVATVVNWIFADLACSVPIPGIPHALAPIPFCARTAWAVDDDGSRMAIASAVTPEQSPPRYRLTVTDMSGAMLWSAEVNGAQFPVTQRAVDSMRNRMVARLPVPYKEGYMAAAGSMRIPRTWPPYSDIKFGADHSIWVPQRTNVGTEIWKVFSANGRPDFTFTLPPNVSVLAADGEKFWASEADADGQLALIRYRVVRK